MKIWEGIVLGFIQGLTEFLPVSSSGHLLFFERLGVGKEDMFFNVCMHIGTLLSVLVATKNTWVGLVKNIRDKTNLCLVVSCLPTVVIALVIKAFAPSLLEGAYLPLGFMITSMLLIGGEKLCFNQNNSL